jgi:hypothetical protein
MRRSTAVHGARCVAATRATRWSRPPCLLTGASIVEARLLGGGGRASGPSVARRQCGGGGRDRLGPVGNTARRRQHGEVAWRRL